MNLSVAHNYNIASFPTLRLNFWAIPRCGSTTIKHYLYRAENPQKFERLKNNKHTKHWVHGACKYITPDEAKKNNFKNFTILRNPVDRIYSMYAALDRLGVNMQGGVQFQHDVRKFWKDRNIMLFLELLAKHSDENRNIHFRSQASYCKLDSIIKLDLATVDSSIGSIHPAAKIDTHLNISKSKSLPSPTKHEEVVKQVHDIFYEDFKIWLPTT